MPDFIRLQGGRPTKHMIQKVRRFLRRTEQRLGITLLIQEYEGGPYYTTITLLRRWLPELFDPDEASDISTEDIEAIKKDVAALQGSQTALKWRVKALGSEVRQLKAGLQPASESFTGRSSL